MKGQSFILEFILFFLISFSLFSLISYNFFSQNIFFKERVGNKTTGLINNLVSTHIVKSLGCKGCDNILITEDIPSKLGESFYMIQLNDKGLNTTLISTRPLSTKTPVFNLNETFNFLSTESTSDNKRVKIKINNEERKIGVE